MSARTEARAWCAEQATRTAAQLVQLEDQLEAAVEAGDTDTADDIATTIAAVTKTRDLWKMLAEEKPRGHDREPAAPATIADPDDPERYATLIQLDPHDVGGRR